MNHIGTESIAEIEDVIEAVSNGAVDDERILEGRFHNLVHGTRYIRVPNSVTGFHTAKDHNGCPTVPRYLRSTDALLSVVATLMPRWRVENLCEWDDAVLRARGPWTADLMRRGKDFSQMFPAKCPHAPTAARALMISILRAILSEVSAGHVHPAPATIC